MLADAALTTTVFDLAIRGLKEEHAACVKRLGTVVADPNLADEARGYLLRIENINQAIIRLAATRREH